jgi:hypothetical protein
MLRNVTKGLGIGRILCNDLRHGKWMRGAYNILVGRPEGRRPLGRPRRRWEDNIKMYLRETGFGDVD